MLISLERSLRGHSSWRQKVQSVLNPFFRGSDVTHTVWTLSSERYTPVHGYSGMMSMEWENAHFGSVCVSVSVSPYPYPQIKNVDTFVVVPFKWSLLCNPYYNSHRERLIQPENETCFVKHLRFRVRFRSSWIKLKARDVSLKAEIQLKKKTTTKTIDKNRYLSTEVQASMKRFLVSTVFTVPTWYHL